MGGNIIQITLDDDIYNQHFLKDNAGVGIIVDYSRDYTIVNDSAKKCEMTSFSITLLHVDLNEAVNLLILYHLHFSLIKTTRSRLFCRIAIGSIAKQYICFAIDR